ncbi:MAG: hypothetical protein AB7K09_05600, partial [Planctomycetota bacterium]
LTPCKGLTDEHCHVFVASGLRPHPLPADATEEIRLLRVTPAGLTERLAGGAIVDGMTLAALSMARRHPLWAASGFAG